MTAYIPGSLKNSKKKKKNPSKKPHKNPHIIGSILEMYYHLKVFLICILIEVTPHLIKKKKRLMIWVTGCGTKELARSWRRPADD